MTRDDLPEVYGGEEKYRLIAKMLNEHGRIDAHTRKTWNGEKFVPVVKFADLSVLHREAWATGWMLEITGMGRTSVHRHVGLELELDQRRVVFHRWQLSRFEEVKILLRRVQPYLAANLKAEADSVLRLVDNWKASRKRSKRGRLIGRRDRIGPAATMMARQTPPTSGLDFIDDAAALEHQQGRTDPTVQPTVERGKTGIPLFDDEAPR
jgi:hypothetical protein